MSSAFPLNFNREFDYRLQERLGCLVGAGEADPAANRLARADAYSTIHTLREIRMLLQTFEALPEETSGLNL